jgi:hypothetical protein
MFHFTRLNLKITIVAFSVLYLLFGKSLEIGFGGFLYGITFLTIWAITVKE